MQTPIPHPSIPQPYDITEIPHIAWVPGTTTWGLLSLGLLALGVIIWLNRRPARSSSTSKVIDNLLTELRTSFEERGELHLERSSRIARRLVSHICGKNLAELTAEELRLYPKEGTSPELYSAIQALARLEELAYAPHSPESHSLIQELGTTLVSLIVNLRSGMRTK